MSALDSIITVAKYHNAHHVRIILTSGEIIAHSSTQQPQWCGEVFDALRGIYELTPRSPSIAIAKWADAGFVAATAAIEEMIATAIEAGSATVEEKHDQGWRKQA